MTLTAEQQERIRVNRARALAIQKERKEQKEKKRLLTIDGDDTNDNNNKKNKDEKEASATKKLKVEVEKEEVAVEKVLMEDFEIGASEFITKTEAMKTYCVPEGTLAVCYVEEKENPHHKSFKPMKLYRRSEIRERAHKRYGGIEGLKAERTKRQERRFAKDVEMAKSIFGS